jgi:hypothetical protein
MRVSATFNEIDLGVRPSEHFAWISNSYSSVGKRMKLRPESRGATLTIGTFAETDRLSLPWAEATDKTPIKTRTETLGWDVVPGIVKGYVMISKKQV